MREKSLVLFLLLFLGEFVSSCRNVRVYGETIHGENGPSSIMLVLGSSDPTTRTARVALACDLIKRNDIHFNKIILSGGCGAHGTEVSNCEATDMQRLLEATCGTDASDILVYKEENSGSTVQNYCYSRNLKEGGEDLIRKEDKLYVVSSHYHALSVAACFRNDGVDAHYYYTCGSDLYDGTPPPLATVAASTAECYRDYAGIAQNCGKTDWCEYQKPKPKP